MYAIIQTGGKQYKVQKDQIISVEKLDAKVGDKVELEMLMLVDDKGKTEIGDLVGKKVCVAEVVDQGKDKKIVVFKFKAKKNYRRKQGHRQPYTAIKILDFKNKK